MNREKEQDLPPFGRGGTLDEEYGMSPVHTWADCVEGSNYTGETQADEWATNICHAYVVKIPMFKKGMEMCLLPHVFHFPLSLSLLHPALHLSVNETIKAGVYVVKPPHIQCRQLLYQKYTVHVGNEHVIHICMHACMYVCIFFSLYDCMYVCMYVCRNVCMWCACVWTR